MIQCFRQANEMITCGEASSNIFWLAISKSLSSCIKEPSIAQLQATYMTKLVARLVAMLQSFFIKGDQQQGNHASRYIRHALKIQLNKMLQFDWLFLYS